MARLIRADRSGAAHLRAEEFKASERARSILQQAERRAQALLPELEAAARRRAEAAADARLTARLLQLEADADAHQRRLEAQTLELARRLAQHLLGAELQQRPERFAKLVARLLRRLRHARTVTLRVHPADAESLTAMLPAGTSSGLRIEQDTTLRRGDCMIDSDVGSLDARLRTRLDELSRALGTDPR
ncbi:MAG: flagellar assembly protein FliH [Myxococcales bacterium]|nr:flagellar assembly protein FliH [Myxococcales bacterium]